MTSKTDVLIPEGLHNYAKSRSSNFVTKLREAMMVIEGKLSITKACTPLIQAG